MLFDLFHDTEFWIGVALLLMIGTLIYYSVPKKMGQALDSRSVRIRSEIDEAGRLHREALALVADYRTKEQEAKAEAEAIVAAAKEEAERLTAEAKRELETALARHQAQAAMKIEQMQAQAAHEVRERAAALAIAAARRLAAAELAGAAGGRLIDTAIEGLGRGLS